MKVTTVNLTKVANALGSSARKTWNYRRIQRFLAEFAFDYRTWSEIVLRLAPIEANFVISIDRANWRFGRFEINILMACIVYQGTAYAFVNHRFDFDGPVYLSLDLDVLDPAFAPGISHHEPGGFSTREVLKMIQNLNAPLVGADLVEFNPRRDPVGITAMLAAKLLKEIAAKML